MKFNPPYTSLKKQAFTLSETLIALVIIGVIAAITVPNINARYSDDITVKKVTKFYSTIADAYQRIKFEEGTPDTWGEYTEDVTENGRIFYDKFKKYLLVQKDCYNNKSGCFASSIYKQFSGGDAAVFTADRRRYNAILLDGSSVSFWVHRKSQLETGAGNRPNSYGVVYIDVNGTRPPNIFGKDTFQFDITADGIYPALITGKKLQNCMNEGYSCSGWIIAHQNMDYKYCPKKILAGATSCDTKNR